MDEVLYIIEQSILYLIIIGAIAIAIGLAFTACFRGYTARRCRPTTPGAGAGPRCLPRRRPADGPRPGGGTAQRRALPGHPVPLLSGTGGAMKQKYANRVKPMLQGFSSNLSAFVSSYGGLRTFVSSDRTGWGRPEGGSDI